MKRSDNIIKVKPYFFNRFHIWFWNVLDFIPKALTCAGIVAAFLGMFVIYG